MSTAKSANLIERDEEPIYVDSEKDLDLLLNSYDVLKKKKSKKFLFRFERVPHRGSLDLSSFIEEDEEKNSSAVSEEDEEDIKKKNISFLYHQNDSSLLLLTMSSKI